MSLDIKDIVTVTYKTQAEEQDVFNPVSVKSVVV